jgi:hypothetical protein
VVAITQLSKEHFADPFAKPEAVLCRRVFELGELRLSNLGAGSANAEIVGSVLLSKSEFVGNNYLFSIGAPEAL